MKIEIMETTDHKFIGTTIDYDGKVDDIYLDASTKVELIQVTIDQPNITLISSNYIISGFIVE